jgi:hypothetical protein
MRGKKMEEGSWRGGRGATRLTKRREGGEARLLERRRLETGEEGERGATWW